MKDRYRNIARFYDAIFDTMNRGLRGIGMNLFPPRAGMEVLDIGCGTGAHLKLYQDSRCHIHGIDTSPAMLDVARHKLGGDADLRTCDATATPFADDTFDLILCSTVLHEMSPDTRGRVLDETRRILKAEGRLLVIDFHTGTRKTFKGIHTKIVITVSEVLAGREHYRNYRHFMRHGGIPGLMDSNRFDLEAQKIVSGGNMGVFLFRKDGRTC
jgi:ubiquinone/menaquinone biosynthesis C-methylase UbiE